MISMICHDEAQESYHITVLRPCLLLSSHRLIYDRNLRIQQRRLAVAAAAALAEPRSFPSMSSPLSDCRISPSLAPNLVLERHHAASSCRTELVSRPRAGDSTWTKKPLSRGDNTPSVEARIGSSDLIFRFEASQGSARRGGGGVCKRKKRNSRREESCSARRLFELLYLLLLGRRWRWAR